MLALAALSGFCLSRIASEKKDSTPAASSESIDQLERGILDQKALVTGRTSESCRYIAFGLLGVYYTLLTSKDGNGAAIEQLYGSLLVWMAVAAAVSILFDYLQYVFARFEIDRAFRSEDKLYDSDSFFYSMREILFWSKQILMLAAVTIFFVVLIRYQFSQPHICGV
jgi:hypothetical protein